MNNYSELVFFVTGINKDDTKGHYLAKFIKSQNGVSKAFYDPKTFTIKIVHDPQIIPITKLEKLTYFSNCKFIVDKDQVAIQIERIRKHNQLKKIMEVGSLSAIILFIGFIGGLLTEKWNIWLLLTALIITLGSLIVVRRQYKAMERYNK